MKIKYDPKADAAYIYLSNKAYAYGKDLDNVRHIDYASDGTIIGVELLCLKKGVNFDNLPEQSKIIKLLEQKNIKVYA